MGNLASCQQGQPQILIFYWEPSQNSVQHRSAVGDKVYTGQMLQSLVPPRANISCNNNNIDIISTVSTKDMSVTNSAYLGKPHVFLQIYVQVWDCRIMW